MKKGKSINIELTEEDLRMKLQQLRQEIQETRERRIAVEITTAVARAANVALNEELVAKMARHAIVKEETTAMRKGDNVFKDNIAMRFQRLHKEYPILDNAVPVPKTMNQKLLKKNLRRKLSTGLLSRDELICVDKLAEHPYFTRSKGPTDSFPSQSSQKGKSTMGDNVEDISLTDVVVAKPIVADQNELIMQLMEQIAEMRVEMQRRQDLPNPAFAFNAPADGRPPPHFPSSSAEQTQNPPSSPAHNPSIIDLTTQNPHYTFASYQTPPPHQNTNIQVPLPPQNANLQTGPPLQNQNVNNP
ncbi:hypothetical protein R3W88_000684 [Solanum pinnatisectum]|uniref:Uncharacterized protein n=1 Tax=Solanum pinnatisectum TaxID=50273 RepID=A0AAV9MG22_9SOLN|nr:hypothetical protein R3W88_000684 [Solanum pinnatisectum]